MRVLVLSFLSAFGLSLVLVPACRWLAVRYGYVAEPKEDRWHRRPTALLGGVAIALSLFGSLAVWRELGSLPVLIGCAAAIFVLGLLDDLAALKPSTKLVVELALASIFLMFSYRLNWTGSLTIDSLLTILWVVGIANAFNLLDNMDGLCGGIAAIAGLTVLASLLPAAPDTLAYAQARYLAMLVGAIAGFLVYNISPASIFLGDSGSLLIGLSFAGLTLTKPFQTPSRGDLLPIVATPVLVLLIPIFDTTLVTLSRILSGRSTSVGGRDHSSHRLVAMGLSERHAVMILWLLAGVGGTIGIVVRRFGDGWSGLLAALFFIGMSLFAVYLGRIRIYEQDSQALKENAVTPLVAEFVYKRRVGEVLLDFSLISIAYYAAYRLRFESAEDYKANAYTLFRSLPVVLAAQLVALFAVGAYRGVWRYFGLTDTIVIGKGVVAGVLLTQLIILFRYRFSGYSRAVYAIYAVLVFLMLTASRASFRLIGEWLGQRREQRQRLVIYGAGDGGSLAVRELVKAQPVSARILGFIDDDPRKVRMRVQGYPVLGAYDALVSLISNDVVDIVVISARIMDVDRLRELEALCAGHGVALSRLHVGLEELLPLEHRPERSSEPAADAAARRTNII